MGGQKSEGQQEEYQIYSSMAMCTVCSDDDSKKCPQLTQRLMPCYSRSDVPSSAVEQNINLQKVREV